MSKTVRNNIAIASMSTVTSTLVAALSSNNRSAAAATSSSSSSSGSLYESSASPSYFYWTGDGGGGSGSGGALGSVTYDSSPNDIIGFGVAVNGSNSSSIAVGTTSQLFSSSVLNYNDTSLNYAYMYNQSSERCPSMDVNPTTTYWNITCDIPLEYGVLLYGYLMPFFMVITCVANLLIVLVLSKKNMATPTNFVLMGMAICDMLTVLFPAPGVLYMYTFGNHYKPLHPVTMCFAYSVFNDIMPTMCHTASIWLTLALAVQRYIYVCHAPMARTWCTMPRVKRCTLYICIVAFLHQSIRFFDYTYYPMVIEWNGQRTEVCHIEVSPWVDNYIGADFYFTSYFLFRVLFVHLVPCVLLVTLNILLFSAMRQAQERRKLLFRENRKKESKKLRESNCTTLMLIVVVTVFLIVEIPFAVVTGMHIVSTLIIEFLDYKIASIFITSTNFFLVVSYPINFAIYCGMSRQFRETFKEIFLGRILTKKDNSSKYSIVNGPRTCTNTNETVL